jgi:exopolysaccharide biosynthesis predicted pyruvyltransferase EpsI
MIIRSIFFAAGIANYHDDIEQYKNLKKYIQCNFHEDRIDIINERNPIALVNWIKNSQLWIGSSLHGRVISSAYSIPRVSLKMGKVSNYCELWDNVFPYNVALDNILGSCEIAWSVEKKYADFQSQFLSEKANINLIRILDVLNES